MRQRSIEERYYPDVRKLEALGGIPVNINLLRPGTDPSPHEFEVGDIVRAGQDAAENAMLPGICCAGAVNQKWAIKTPESSNPRLLFLFSVVQLRGVVSKQTGPRVTMLPFL